MPQSDERKGALRIGFIHPDLGIGGAERLVVDAAVSLQQRGHEVVLFTSRHDPHRCFEETRDGNALRRVTAQYPLLNMKCFSAGTLEVHVLGNSIFPRNFMNAFNIIFASLRQLHLTFLLILSIYLPFRIPQVSPLAPLDRFDVFIVDQLSICVPVLRWITGSRVVFYCHFPDKLLSGGWEITTDTAGGAKIARGAEKKQRARGSGILKRLYRWPFDKLEEITTGQWHVISRRYY